MLSANISKFNKSVLPIIAFILNVIFYHMRLFFKNKKRDKRETLYHSIFSANAGKYGPE